MYPVTLMPYLFFTLISRNNVPHSVIVNCIRYLFSFVYHLPSHTNALLEYLALTQSLMFLFLILSLNCIYFYITYPRHLTVIFLTGSIARSAKRRLFNLPRGRFCAPMGVKFGM